MNTYSLKALKHSQTSVYRNGAICLNVINESLFKFRVQGHLKNCAQIFKKVPELEEGLV